MANDNLGSAVAPTTDNPSHDHRRIPAAAGLVAQARADTVLSRVPGPPYVDNFSSAYDVRLAYPGYLDSRCSPRDSGTLDQGVKEREQRTPT